MIEFKFSCPNCSQHLQCNDSYSGRQIACPTCKNLIVVPQPPTAVSPARAAMPSPPPPPAHSPSAISQSTFPPHSNAKKNSRTKLIAVCGTVALLLIGVGAYAFFAGVFSDRDNALTRKPAVTNTSSTEEASSDEPASSRAESFSETPRSINTEAPSAEEIVRKVMEKYSSLKSYSASGTAISITMWESIPAMSGNVLKNVREKMGSEFSVKLGKPGFYLVEFEWQMGPAKWKGAVWSSGAGNFLLVDMGQTTYVKMQNRDKALGLATGAFGGAAHTMPQIFFKGNGNLLDSFKNAARHEDERIDGDECYVLSGVVMGKKIILWIDQDDFLIKQKQRVVDGELDMPEMTEDQIQEALWLLGPSKEQEAQIRASMKNMKAMTLQMKGTITETYRNIQINRPVKSSDFNHKVPAGTPLSSSLF